MRRRLEVAAAEEDHEHEEADSAALREENEAVPDVSRHLLVVVDHVEFEEELQEVVRRHGGCQCAVDDCLRFVAFDNEGLRKCIGVVTEDGEDRYAARKGRNRSALSGDRVVRSLNLSAYGQKT